MLGYWLTSEKASSIDEIFPKKVKNFVYGGKNICYHKTPVHGADTSIYWQKYHKNFRGQRRVGKSCILKAVAQDVSRTVEQANVITINLEDFAFSHIRDVVSRHSLRNTDFLQRLLLFLAGNVGQIFTTKRIADYMNSQRMTVIVGALQSLREFMLA